MGGGGKELLGIRFSKPGFLVPLIHDETKEKGPTSPGRNPRKPRLYWLFQCLARVNFPNTARSTPRLAWQDETIGKSQLARSNTFQYELTTY